METMSPAQMAVAECANYTGGRCVLFDGVCVVSLFRKCDCFEQSVLPLADKEVPHRRLYEAAREAYFRQQEESDGGQDRICPDCGAKLTKRQRVCRGCARERRKKTKRSSWRKRATRQLAQNADS